MREVDVLIAGGGPVGLTASILLSRLGVTSLLVERHPGTSIHPKARGINTRTMEIFRQCGVESAIRAAGLAPERSRFIVWSRSLAGEELERRVPARSRPEAQQISPVLRCLCAQDDLEPVLRAHAESLAPGRLRFSTELIDFRQDAEHVGATLREDGDETTVRARYLVAADGARSRVREALGIAMQGTAGLYRSINVLLRADLTPWVADRPAALYFIEQPGLKATFLTINGVNRWGFLINNLPLNGAADEYSAERCAAIIRQAAGVPDLDVEILGAVPWVAAAQVAERYRDGRVFLAGDAAHHMPPTGGFGMNTGVQDVHNLAWKLHAVLRGWAGPELLASYEDERLPYGRAITEQSLANARSLGRGESLDPAAPAAGMLARPEFLNELGMIFGASYTSSAIVPDGTPPVVVANPVTDYVPTARPGARAPHVWLERDGSRLSTLDLFGHGFVLLTGAGAAWREAAEGVAMDLGVPLAAFAVGLGGDLGDPDKRWAAAYGVGSDGAVLVRPDGHVGWRSSAGPSQPRAQVARALRTLVATWS
ncbi:MAG TPA: FAD-dependent monooxygenase [Candidatus Acidoferrum sp.]|nr:FAD-dependent monooxygenase [Candidatus Acidoferrum sp.]